MSLSQFLKTNSDIIVEVSHELQELLQSLPKVSAWGDDLYQYQGFWYYDSLLEAAFFSQNHFKATDTDVLLVTPPKSGTTWLKSLVYSITQRSRYAPNDPNHPLLTSSPHALVPSFEIVYNHNKNPNFSHLPSPRLFPTHLPYNLLPDSVKNANCRIIYLCRDPKDNFVSWWHFINKLVKCPIPLEKAFEFYCDGINPYGPVWDHVLGYWDLSLKAPQKVLFLRYEDLKGNTAPQVKKIAEFLGSPFSPREEEDGLTEEITKMCSFENLSNLEVNKSGRMVNFLGENKSFFRKGEVGDWENYLTPSMAKKLDKVTEEKLLGSGLSFC